MNGPTAAPQPLDAYSEAVTRVAAALLPAVASLRVGRGGTGSAVAVGEGLLVTSAHVVGRRSTVRARFDDGEEVEGEVCGTDPLSDLAVVRLPPTGVRIEVARLGDADTLRVGQLVIAVGSPLGYEGSVSAGVVSGLGRSLVMGDGRHQRLVDNVIQTDASLHPGNSGGALADSAGAVVGINTAIVGPGVGQGLGLAVPVNERTKRIIEELARTGLVQRAWLGVGGGTQRLSGGLASTLGQQTALAVTSVVEGSPAARSGLVPGDLVIALDGARVRRIADLQRLLDGEADREVRLTIVRSGERRTVPVTLQRL